MQIDKEKVRLYKTKFGLIIGQEADPYPTGFDVKLEYPFQLVPVPQQGGFGISAIGHDDDWCLFNVDDVIELSVSAGLLDIYEEYVDKVHSSLILPEKKSIILP